MPEAISTAAPPSKRISTTIRPATSSDAAQIAVLGAKIFSTTFGYSLPPSDLAAYLQDAYTPTAIGADISNPAMSTFIACPTHDPSIVLGFSQLTRGTYEPCLEGSPKPVELQRLYVSTEAHGMGLGRKLVTAVEDKAREEGYETLWLGVWEENVKAQGFYKAVGLEKCGGHEFTMGTCVQMDHILKKSL